MMMSRERVAWRFKVRCGYVPQKGWCFHMSRIIADFVQSDDFQSVHRLMTDISGGTSLPEPFLRTMHAMLRGREQIPRSTYDFWNRGSCYVVNRFAFEALFETLMRYGHTLGDGSMLYGDGSLGRLCGLMMKTMIPAKVGAAIRRLNGKLVLHPYKIEEMHELALGVAFSATDDLLFPKKVTNIGKSTTIEGQVYDFYVVNFYGRDCDYVTPVLQTRQAKFDPQNFSGWWRVSPLEKWFRNLVPPTFRGQFKQMHMRAIRPGRSNLANYACNRVVKGYLEMDMGARVSRTKDTLITEHREERLSRKKIIEFRSPDDLEFAESHDGDNTNHRMTQLAWHVFKKHAKHNPLVSSIIYAMVDNGCEDLGLEHQMARFNEKWTSYGNPPVGSLRAFFRKREEAILCVREWQKNFEFDLS